MQSMRATGPGSIPAKRADLGRRAVFFDRDGVVNQDLAYSYRPSDLVLFDDVAPVLIELKRRNYLLIVVTNQSGVARGFFNLSDVFAFHQAIQFELKRRGAPGFDAFYLCPHLDMGVDRQFVRVCECRKPKPGMLLDAVGEFAIDPQKSVLVGDRESDLLAGRSAGVTSVLLDRSAADGSQKGSSAISSLSELLPYALP